MKHLLLEADSTTELNTSRCLCVEDITSHNSNRTFSPAKDNLKSNVESHSMFTIHDLHILYSELYDML